jgi:hypothetical protein
VAVGRWNPRALSAPNDLSRVVILRLEGVLFNDMTAFAQFVCAFPHLQSLSVGGVLNIQNTPKIEEPHPNAFCPSPKLFGLELNFIPVVVLLEWFLSLPVHPAFRSVCLREIWGNDLDIVSKFLAAFGNSLESFCLSVNFDHGTLSFRTHHLIHHH